MPRKKVHSEEKEPILEKFLSWLRFRKIDKYIKPESVLLDLGCGFKGNFLKSVENKIARGVGLDISVEKNLYSAKLKLIEHNLNNPLSFLENEFDTFVFLANLEHLDEPKQVLAEIYRVLKPKGKLLLTAPSVYAKPVLEFLATIGFVSRQEIKDHKNYFNKKILLDLSRKSGFSFVQHKYFQMGMNNFLIAIK